MPARAKPRKRTATSKLSPRQAGRLVQILLDQLHGSVVLTQLLALNLEVAAKIERGQPVTAPGTPKNYPDPKKLVTEDCIRPVEASA